MLGKLIRLDKNMSKKVISQVPLWSEAVPRIFLVVACYTAELMHEGKSFSKVLV